MAGMVTRARTSTRVRGLLRNTIVITLALAGYGLGVVSQEFVVPAGAGGRKVSNAKQTAVQLVDHALAYPGWGAACLGLAQAPCGRDPQNYTGNATGYAFGNSDGASNTPAVQGTFANHSNAYCPSDPAASWPYGTSISLSNPATVTEHNGDTGRAMHYGVLDLEDIGDSNCDQESYWLDIYFGRYKRPSDVCDCNPGPEVCTDTQYEINNCTDAIYWGNVTTSYSGP